MLRTIRKYQKSVLGVVSIGLVALAMSGFGMNYFSKHDVPYAIKVGSTEIPYSQLATERRATEDRYQQMLGQAYSQLFKTLQQDLPQQVVDQVVDREVLQQAAKQAGLYVGDDQLRAYVLQKVFPNGFNQEQYSDLLRRQGVDARQFEDTLRQGLAQEQLTQLVNLAALPSEYEAKAFLQREEQSYDIQYVAMNPKPILDTLPDAPDEAIKSYYESNSASFETPSEVSYEYAEFKPEVFEPKVEVHPEDIELEYTENLKHFMTPLEINVRHIQINVAKDADEATKKKAQDKANEVLNKLKSGEDFAALAKQYSNDTATALLGGSLGWLKRGTMNPAFDKAAFELGAGALSDVIEAPYGFHIAKVEERHEPQQKSLEDVKAEIEKTIRKREAPALAASLAQEYADEFKKTTVSLAEFLKQKGLEDIALIAPLSSETSTGSNASLTKAVLSLNGDSGVVELKNSFIVHVLQRKESAIRPLSEVRSEIIATLKAQAASEALVKKASEIVAKISDGSLKTIADVATAAGSQVVSSPKTKLHDQVSGFLGDKKVKDAITGITIPPHLIADSFLFDGNVYLLQVNATELPAEKDIAPKVAEQKEQVAQKLSQTLSRELSEKLKSETEIDVKPEALR